MIDATPPFRHPLRVRYAEADYQGLVYFAHYATYCDLAIHEFFRALPYDYAAIGRTSGADFNIVRLLVEYRRPLRFDQLFEVEVGVARIGRSSVTFQPRIFADERSEPLASAEMVWVHADQTTMRSVPLPDRLRALLQPHQRP